MTPYVFLLRKLNHEGKFVIHSSWIGYKRLPQKVIQNKTYFWEIKRELEQHGYTLQRLA